MPRSDAAPAGRRVRRAPIRAALTIDAPPAAVRAAVTSTHTWVGAATACGLRLDVAGAPGGPAASLIPGGSLRWGRDSDFLVAAPASPELVRLLGVDGHAGWTVTVTAGETRAGSVVTVTLLPGPRGRVRRTLVLRCAQLLLGVARLTARTLPNEPPGPRAP